MTEENTVRVSLHGRRFGIGPNGELILDGQIIANTNNNPLLTRGMPNAIDPAFCHTFFDDFFKLPIDAEDYTEIDDATTGTNALQDAAGGVLGIVTAAADNDYHAISSIAESWLFAANKPLWFEARLKLAEATTDDSAWWIGLTDTLTTGGFQANALGPLASYDGALFFKDEDTLTLDFETSNAGTQVTSAAVETVISDTWVKVAMFFDGDPTGSGTGTILPMFDVGDGNGWQIGTAHSITLAGLEEMHLVAGVKAGPGGAAETLQVDYINVVQYR